jgi:hypothetical protein
MVMYHWGGPGLVKAYALELLVDAARQRAAARPPRSRRRLTAAIGRARRATGALLTRLGDGLAARPATSPVSEICR